MEHRAELQQKNFSILYRERHLIYCIISSSFVSSHIVQKQVVLIRTLAQYLTTKVALHFNKSLSDQRL